MRKSFVSRTIGFLPFALLAGTSCSLVYDLSPDQCGSNDDCAHFGPGLVCNRGICECGDPSICGTGASGGTGAKGGNGGKGGTSFVGGTGGTLPGGAAGATDVGGTGGATNGGTSTGAKGGTGTKGGSSNGGTSNGGTTGGTTTGGTGGGGGVPEVPECATNLDCANLVDTATFDSDPRACIDGVCKQLLNKDCPFLFPLRDQSKHWNALKSTDAIILGALTPIVNKQIDTYSRNIDFAATELYQEAQGVYSGSTKRHQLMFVVCNDYYNGNQAQILANSQHLINDLHVPGIVASLFLADQQYIWDNIASDTGTFMMMTLTSDESLIETEDDGLMWHELSGANALSVPYQALFDMTLDHLRTLGTPALGMTEDVKVSHVISDEQFNLDTGKYIEAHLQFNGKSVSENSDANLYDAMSVVSDVTDPTDHQQTAIDRILNFGPHIVIGTATTEMLKYIIPGVEAGWDAKYPGRQRPFYLMGAMVYNDPEVATLISTAGASSPPLFQRFIGLNWPAAKDQTINDAYQARWKLAYGKEERGYENFYDATYYMMYGVAAARVPITGQKIRDGITRVTSTLSTVPVAAVGPNADMDQYIHDLSTDTSLNIQLVGAMGPPTWDIGGGRNDPGSVWCVNNLGTSHPDQLYYNKETSSLDGYVDCFTFDGRKPPTP
jgi:hypothetical protein